MEFVALPNLLNLQRCQVRNARVRTQNDASQTQAVPDAQGDFSVIMWVVCQCRVWEAEMRVGSCASM